MQEPGKAFIAAIMEVQGREVPDYCGMFSTFLNGYVLTFDLTARERRLLERQASKLVKIRLTE